MVQAENDSLYSKAPRGHPAPPASSHATQRTIGICRESKSPWERRVPVTPEAARRLRDAHGIHAVVQPSPTRIFTDDEFKEAGAALSEELHACPVVFGVKEVPLDLLRPNTTYVFFAHVIKGQPHNMPLLQRALELGCTLIDYERVADERGRRLIFFGHQAGLAGMIETLWALGRRLAWEGIRNPFEAIRHAYEYRDAASAQEAVAEIGAAIRADGLPEAVCPVTIGVAGYGNVARGAWEILDLLPVQRIEPAGLAAAAAGGSRSAIVAATFKEKHTVEPAGGGPFDLARYYEHPEEFRPVFERYLPHLTVMVNAIYWEPRYPRLVTLDGLRRMFASGRPKLRLIGDISCDIGGAVECTVRAGGPGDPVFVYNPLNGEAPAGVEGEGVVVMAVDILPSELPRDASVEFSRVLEGYIPAIAAADYAAPFAELALPAEIKRAVIAHRGELAPDYRYLSSYLPAQGKAPRP